MQGRFTQRAKGQNKFRPLHLQVERTTTNDKARARVGRYGPANGMPSGHRACTGSGDCPTESQKDAEPASSSARNQAYPDH